MLSRLRRDERGIALITVMMATFVTLTLVTVAVSSAVSSRSLSRRDQDWNAALAAAEAGVDDYLYRINRDGFYWQYSDILDPPDGNQAFKDWVDVPGPANEGQFRYDVDTSRLATEGVIGLTATGRLRNTARSVEVTMRRRNFLDYLYFTDYETKDPAIYSTADGDDYTPAQAQVRCALHYYEARDVAGRVDFAGDTDGPVCTDIFFITRDTVNGPLHSNDAILISGNPRFLGPTSTSWDDPSGQGWRGSGSPFFANAGDPRLVAPLTIPPSNTELKAETDPITGGTGCLFTGPTRIILNSSGTMDVTSPFTRASNCLVGSGVPLPANGVIYVQNVPADPADPNYTAGCPPGYGVGYPIPSDITTYGCRDGDVFLEGTLNGRLTIAAEHSIIITWHTQYAGGVGGDDLLGLVANNYVEVYHPVRSSSPRNLQVKPGLYFQDPVIQAAMLSVLHSFRVQNYRWGVPLGKLNVTGAIAQRYRGIVGTFSGPSPVSGYEKNYVYDQRLKYQSPPHFLDPVKSAWQNVTWAERPPAYAP